MEVTIWDGEGNVGVSEESVYSTSILQSTHRVLQQITAPTTTPSPQPHTFLTPYKYRGCRAIPEETEDQENIDPRTWMLKDSTSTTRSQGGCSEDASVNNDSSPFAYPLIWESHHSSLSVSSPSGLSPSHTKRPSHKDTAGAFESPVSHKSVEREGSGKGKVRNRSASSSEASCSKASCIHQGSSQSVTPSKTSLTPGCIITPVFRTPSDRFSSKVGENRGGVQTPKQPKASPHPHPRNPFEPAAESLHLPSVSPSLFRQVVSPSQQVDSKFRWSIDQLAILNPANIETSPFNQTEVSSDPEYEQQAQDAIDRFFTQHHVVPSPWTGSNKAVNLLKMIQPLSDTPASLPSPRTHSVWCQTELSLPPTLPEAVEEALQPFYTFTQDQWWQGGSNDCDEGSNINNSTLRRKLLFSQDELLNATPMCSPKGTDASDIVSPSSSPGGPLPSHNDMGSPSGDEEEAGLTWSSVVVGPCSAVMAQQHPHLARCPPPTPPSPSSTHLSHLSPSSSLPTCHPSHVLPSPVLSTAVHHPIPPLTSPVSHGPICSPPQALSSSVTSLPVPPPSSSISPITYQYSRGSPVISTSPQPLVSTEGIISSPDLSPVILERHTVIPSDKLLSSPNVSPIHRQHINSEEDKKQPPASVTSPDSDHVSSSPRHNCASPDGQFVITKISGFDRHASHDLDKASHIPVSLVSSPAERSGSRKKTSNPQHLLSQASPSPSTSELQNHPQSQVRSECSGGPLDLSRRYSAELGVVSTVEGMSNSTQTGSTQVSVSGKHHQQSGMLACMEAGITADVEGCGRRMGMELNVTQEFSVAEGVEAHHQHTPARTSQENKTSGSAGHFSSSPIRDASRTPQEAEQQNHHFSDSPPLSPILCRSVTFPASLSEVVKLPDFLQQPNKSLPSLALSHSMAVADDEDDHNCTTAELMVSDSQKNPLSSLARPSRHSRPLSFTLARSSSICDMETDSQPSIELMGCDDGPSQDTGYQTGSLHATNFSLYNQDLTTITTTVPPPHLADPTTPHLTTCTEKEQQNGLVVWDKDVMH